MRYTEKRGVEKPAEPDSELGASRRVAPGVRRAGSEFFTDGHLDRPLTRGDFLNLHAMVEYHRRERNPLRRLYRWLRGWPQVANMNGGAAAAHARQLAEIQRRLTERDAMLRGER